MNRSGTKLPLKGATRLLAFLALAAASACGGANGGTLTPNASVTAQDVTSNYAAIVLATYQDSLTLAGELNDAITAFLANPTPAAFRAAKDAWLASREVYGQTEVYRFYSGPIDDADGPEGLINAWPLDESRLDYVDGNATAGIVNDPNFDITKDNLADFNERDADDAISTGFHAIEFLLWGQDLNANPSDAGLRPHTDFVVGGTADNQERRRLYLQLAGELLVEHLESVVAEWQAGGANYRTEFLGVASNEALRRMLVGMGSLAGGELAGERMSVALVTRDQEDEHSCFSDNTHRDIATNFQGIRNVYQGIYTRPNGATVGSGDGLEDLIRARNSGLADRMTAQFNAIAASVEEISDLAEAGTPFDQQVTGNNAAQRARVQSVVDALNGLAQQLSEAAEALDININLDTNGQ